MILNSLFIIPASVYAASSPWTQTDWSGGSGQTAWSDTTKYSSGSSVDATTTSGQVTLTNTEKLSNTGFETDLSSWNLSALTATGGTITTSGGYTIHTFTTSGTFTPSGSGNVEYLVVAGGGGASSGATGGAGAGGVRSGTGYSVTAQAYTVTVGAGGVGIGGAIQNVGNNGSNSVFDTITSVGGGASRTSGGSGGGADYNNFNGQGSGTAGQGNNGGNSNGQLVPNYVGGGGGGAGAVGEAAPNNNQAGAGGIGLTSSITGSSVYYAGGGGGGSTSQGGVRGLGGLGGGGDGAITYGANGGSGTANTGGGGGGTHTGTGGSGGSGIVIVRYPALTITRDTTTTYNSSAGSAKLVNGSSAQNFTQTVNVGDTNTYNLSAYAYTDGSAVTSSDAELFYNGSTVSTTYTSVGSGWYQLTGTVTGANASRVYGVQVAANKTVYLDNMSLNNYASSGTLTSSIFDSGQGSNWGTLTYVATTPSNTSVAVKVRTSSSSSMSGATAFASCTAISSGADISSNSCVTDSHRYVQYLLTLANTDSTSTPTFTSFSLAFSSYDADAPSISLTALTPDPNSDNTPTLSGTTTDSIGTVSNVQFQMDSTSGSWTACTATDGSFNSASEAFSCTASTLTDGSHTMYVRATDSNSNTTSNANASTDTFTIDVTNPVSIDLDSPGDNSYTNSERPTFKWKATTDATAGLSKYVLEIDNPSIGSSQPSGDFTIDNIPTSGTTDITSNNKYVIHFDGFSDSDSTNNYISVYTRSTSDPSAGSGQVWGSSENDGKLREGRISWKVKAVDNAGNETSSSRTLFVDRTNPNVEFTQINEIATSQAPRNDGMSTTDKTPTLFGKITDPLSGGDSIATLQNDTGPKVASGPKSVEIKIEKVEKVLGVASNNKLITIYTINMDKALWTCTNKEITDNSKQKCNKYLPFEYTSKENLDFGTYKITLSGKDKADNPSGETILTLNITTLNKITTTEEKKIIEEEIRKLGQDDKSLTPEQQEQVKQELEITKPTGEVPVSILEKAGQNISQATNVILERAKRLIGSIFSGIGDAIAFGSSMTINGVSFAYNTVNSINAFVNDKTFQGIAFIFNKTGEGLAFVSSVNTSINGAIFHNIEIATSAIGNGLYTVTGSIGQGYNNIANNAPGVTKNILLAIGNGISTVGTTIGDGFNAIGTTTHNIADATGNFIGSTANNIGAGINNTGTAIADGFNNTSKSVNEGITQIAFGVGEKVQDVSGTVGIAIIKFTYNFVPEPTRIANVKVLVLSPTSVKVSWLTNHPANGKVNYGFGSGDYAFEQQTDKRTTAHEFVINNLTPDTEYHYEVMSQNKNYVYDANRTFRTPKK